MTQRDFAVAEAMKDGLSIVMGITAMVKRDIAGGTAVLASSGAGLSVDSAEAGASGCSTLASCGW